MLQRISRSEREPAARAGGVLSRWRQRWRDGAYSRHWAPISEASARRRGARADVNRARHSDSCSSRSRRIAHRPHVCDCEGLQTVKPCLIANSAILLRLLLLLSAHTYCAIHTRRYFTSYLYPSITWLLENSLVLTHMILCCTIAPYAHTFHAGGRAATVSAAAAPRTGRCGESAVWNCRGSRCDKSCTTCLYLVLQWI